ncbi:hypothetical protein SAMD00019534_069520 [Acytostelium subglobosum LB1]|uniref:hypothetical protein n=1 Tax=Acytostelium subglobosum LB1 TaxID=1410327 RepID=UPI0006448260|nr:hypothetical protein SAMD00019534_069520 [Acytostelium subglobosum LB1]GAM23777.1 hypothetical protein SAMD00019534_069520 [Acytostelium subglobosum LB1]|eukprot:XP_012753518.1 hypothetical protein SAMD00019534_069520 [Acytostelium subglobosum LB1]
MDTLPIVVLQVIVYHSDPLDRVCLLLTCQRFKTTLLSRKLNEWSSADDSKIYLSGESTDRRSLFARGDDMDFGLETLPPSITSLTSVFHRDQIDDYEQMAIDDVLPPSLTYLSFSNKFDRTIPPGLLPSSITSLSFGSQYNRVINVGVLPASLKVLSFGSWFNRPIIPGSLPDSLTVLSLQGFRYNKPFDSPGIIPRSLITLKLGSSFNHSLFGILPSTLRTLGLGYSFDQELSCDWLPDSLTELCWDPNAHLPSFSNQLPTSIKSLKFGAMYNRVLIPGSLPRALESLHFERDYNQVISTGLLPSTLTSLHFGMDFNQVITEGMLPESLIDIQFGYDFDQVINHNTLPSTNLQSLSFGKGYKKPISPYTLPVSLTSLALHNPKYQEDIGPNVLPRSLVKLDVGSVMIKNISFPPALRILNLSRGWDKSLMTPIPSSVDTMWIVGGMDNQDIPYLPSLCLNVLRVHLVSSNSRSGSLRTKILLDLIPNVQTYIITFSYDWTIQEMIIRRISPKSAITLTTYEELPSEHILNILSL